jgi:hypothetical protein
MRQDSKVHPEEREIHNDGDENEGDRAGGEVLPKVIHGVSLVDVEQVP